MARPTAEARPANRLLHEKSPYLQQHAHNPVDWYPWGREALDLARQDGKPVFLSIGYSACHWCHVMERESFEDEEVAAYLNENFVSIKVDREERPDLDDIYMTAVQLMTGAGGWPLSVFLTPDLKPFYGGTYFPPIDFRERPAFMTVLRSVIAAWEERHAELNESADEIAGVVRQHLTIEPRETAAIDDELLDRAVSDLCAVYDPWEGGFGGAPKFPPVHSLAFLLRQYRKTRDGNLLDMVMLTLDKMARGGIYDQLGGGFHRYSTDVKWLVPHFEKMLYDNAQLAQVYTEAFQLTQNPLYERVVRETLGYVLRDMQAPDGGFCSAEDADSDGQEGAFYLWTEQEIYSALGEDRARIFKSFFGTHDAGNFTSADPSHGGMNILHASKNTDDVAREFHMPVQELDDLLNDCRLDLLNARDRRPRPKRDDKVLAAWNGLMISAFAKGYQVFQEPKFLEAAEHAAGFILKNMTTRDGRLSRMYRDGETRRRGFLEDYAFFVSALIDLYETTFDPLHLGHAEALMKTLINHYWDDDDKGFFMTADDSSDVIVRPKLYMDGAEPSGNSIAALALFRLGRFRDNPVYQQMSRDILARQAAAINRMPRAFIGMLCTADFVTAPSLELAVAGDLSSDEAQALLRMIRTRFSPTKIVTGYNPANAGVEDIGTMIPMLRGKEPADGRPAVYVCRDCACRAPVTDPEALRLELDMAEEEA